MRRSVALAMAAVGAIASLAVVVVVALEVLGDDSDGESPSRLVAGSDGPADTSEPLDQGSFCVAIRDLDALGARPSAGGGTPAQVLAQNAEFAALVDAATTDLPSDAPPVVTEFLEDNRALSAAITAAGGDPKAAFAALTASDPELVDRLAESSVAHAGAFRFFAQRCGTAPPP
ncbi:MAG: hypothetical protein ACOYXM_09415 [Actinomycetota bacterium]